MRVARLELTGVGPFEGAVFEIPDPPAGTRGELTFFEGPNGCGKTTIAEAIAVFTNGGELSAPVDQFARRFDVQRAAPVKGEAFIRLEHGDSWWRTLAFQPGRAGPWNGTPGPAFPPSSDVTWAAFAYQGHQATPVIATKGPTEIETPPLRGALSFGADSASTYFGQFLINTEFDRVKAALYAQEQPASEKREEMARIAEARRDSLQRFERVFCRVLDRDVRIEFPFGHHSPDVSLDSEQITLDLLGEGMRSTVAWLSDLLVRLERIAWADRMRSPLEQDFWLILDEIDTSLHPNLQAHIYPALRELFPNARIYATTHSPFVIASAAEGVVFPIRPGKDHKVHGVVEARKLEPGQTLEYVTTEIFQARDGFVDQKTRDMLDEHRRDIRRFRKTKSMDWDAFFVRRAKLFELNDEVRTAVAIQEVPVRREVDDQMLARAEAREQRELGTGA